MAFHGSFGFGWGLTTWVKRLLIANAAVFLLTWIVPMLLPHLALVPGAVLVQPWTLITYSFVHGGFLHLAFNMLALFFFGPPLEARWGGREFIKYYLLCALGGAALSFVFAGHAAVVGASAAVFGVMLAFALNWPDAPIYFFGIFPVKAKWLVAILAAFSLFSAMSGAQDGTAHFAHLGGFVAGFLYLKVFDAIGYRLRRLKKSLPRSRFSVIPGAGDAKVSAPAEPRRLRRREEERLLDEVDRVLDKISESGLASLSADERQVLDEASRRYRQN
jgi:membrane associated rhomboid family serine protease